MLELHTRASIKLLLYVKFTGEYPKFKEYKIVTICCITQYLQQFMSLSLRLFITTCLQVNSAATEKFHCEVMYDFIVIDSSLASLPYLYISKSPTDVNAIQG